MWPKRASYAALASAKACAAASPPAVTADCSPRDHRDSVSEPLAFSPIRGCREIAVSTSSSLICAACASAAASRASREAKGRSASRAAVHRSTLRHRANSARKSSEVSALMRASPGSSFRSAAEEPEEVSDMVPSSWSVRPPGQDPGPVARCGRAPWLERALTRRPLGRRSDVVVQKLSFTCRTVAPVTVCLSTLASGTSGRGRRAAGQVSALYVSFCELRPTVYPFAPYKGSRGSGRDPGWRGG